MTTIVDIIKKRASEHPDRIAVIFDDYNEKSTQLTNQEIDRLSRQFAAGIQQHCQVGDRVLILVQPGREYLCTFLGSLYAGVIAVPSYPVKPGRSMAKLRNIIADCDPRLVICNRIMERHLNEALVENNISRVKVLSAEDLDAPGKVEYQDTAVNGHHIALLQYTSGSTGTPKGVVIRHSNIIENEIAIQKSFEYGPQSKMVSWLPPFHDMGLIGGILQPLYTGFTTILMSPASFLQRPLSWLQVMSRYQATTSGSPNFGYDLCIRKINEQDLKNLDLSQWDVAYNGSEPVKADTLRHFAAKFAPAGFRAHAFLPCYGMAESTLLVSGRKLRQPAKSIFLNRDTLERGELRISTSSTENGEGGDTKEVVSTGGLADGFQVKIVDPTTLLGCDNHQIGEIWIRGSSIASGYWRKNELSETIFKARLDNQNYLRTGDLGFLHEGQLYVTGRIKESLIIRGRKLYPHDVEDAVRQIPEFQGATVAAFQWLVEGAGQLGIAIELERKVKSEDFEGYITAIKRKITEDAEIAPALVVLLKAHAMPKTSSGKIQRALIAEMLQASQLDTHCVWQQVDSSSIALEREASVEQPKAIANGPIRGTSSLPKHKEIAPKMPKVSELKAWLRQFAATRLNSRLADERRCFAPHVVLELGNHGLFGYEPAPALGGLGLNMAEAMAITQQLGAIDLTLASMVGIHNSLGLRPILKYGAETHAELLPWLAQGRMLASFALTEPSAGSNPRSLKTKAVQSGDRIVINGEKKYIGLAGWAGVVNVFAQHYIDDVYQGISCFVVKASDPGFLVGEEELTMGVRAIVQNELRFENCTISSDRLLGKAGRGFEIAQDAMGFARLGLGAMAVGGMKTCIQTLIKYSQQRSISTGLMIDNRLIQGRLSDFHAMTHALECLVSLASQVFDHAEAFEELPLVCKVIGSEFLWTVVDGTMQFLGGRGYTENNLIPQFFRDARLIRIFEGPTEALFAYLGTKVVKDHNLLVDRLAAIQPHSSVVARMKVFFKNEMPRILSSQTISGHNQIADIVAHYLLAFSVEKTSADNRGLTSNWLENRIQQLTTLATLTDQKSSHHSKASLQEIDRSYEADIGFIYQQLPGELRDRQILLDAGETLLSPKLSEEVAQPFRKPEGIPLSRPITLKILRREEEDSLSESTQETARSVSVQQITLDQKAPIAGQLHEVRHESKASEQKIPVPVTHSHPAQQGATKVDHLIGVDDAEDLESWLIAWLANETKSPIQSFSPTGALSSLGLDSIVAVEAVAALETKTKLRLPNDLFWTSPTLRDVVKFIKGRRSE